MPIDKLAWIHVENKKVLFVRSRGKDLPYCPGGKREAGESDEQALVREIREELDVELIPETISYQRTVTAQAHGQPEGVMVQMKCFSADFVGTLAASSEIEEMEWLTSANHDRLSVPGKLIVSQLLEDGLID